ncbi:CUGBP Elav-like member 2 [Ranunculus cassubicifolius]
MSKAMAIGILFLCLVLFVSAEDIESRCNCDDDDEGFWSIDSIMHCQQVSDFLIAIAYFSIPLEILYFISCSNIPFKWVLVQFIAFIVLCGMTHLLNGWTYAPHTFQLMLALTVFKILTALVSCATAITLITLIPLLLKLKVRELFLTKKAWELDREVGMMKKQKEASWHVRMLTHEIRKSLDRHTILYTTLIELSNTLDLQNCAVWMPNENRTEMNLTHELKGRSRVSIPYSDPDVFRIKKGDGVKILRPDSALGVASSGGVDEWGAVAAMRMPMLKVSDFKGGTPELIQACYAILVLVLPYSHGRSWSYQELEIVKVVADQVAVALSHAAVLEESQLMREKLVEQNRALQQAQQDAMMASQARNAFQMVMSKGMRRPMHSISGLLSMIQQEGLGTDQKIIVDTMVKTSNVLSTLINDVMEISSKDTGRLPLELRPFQLHSMIKEAACLAKCLCVSRGCRFLIDIDSTLPNWVMGDERRIFQVILHMIGNLLDGCDGVETVTFRTSSVGEMDRNDQRRAIWRQSPSEGYISIKFEIGIDGGKSPLAGSLSHVQLDTRKYTSEGIDSGLSFSMCKKLVQMMQGNIWVVPSTEGLVQSMTLVLKFELQPSGGSGYPPLGLPEYPPSNSQFRGLRVLLADDDSVNRLVTRKLLEKLGCLVFAVSSGFECLNAIGPAGSSFEIILLDLHMPEMDGFEVAMRISKLRSRSFPLIVALTASADEDIWSRCLQVGMNGLIRKPVLLEGMAIELHKVLQQANIGGM